METTCPVCEKNELSVTFLVRDSVRVSCVNCQSIWRGEMVLDGGELEGRNCCSDGE